MRDSKKREFNLGVRSYELTIIGIILVSILFVSLQDRIGGVAEPSGQAIVSPPSSGFGGLQARPSNPVAVVEHHCGNGKLEVSAGEVCDDGNKDNGDGCSRTCQFEPGFTKICTAIELDNVRNDLSGKYIQICDIDVSLLPTYPMKPIGKVSIPSSPFTGIYNGNGRTINNFVYSGTSYSALFGYVRPNARIVNVRMINCDVTGTSSVGCLVGSLSGDVQVIDSSARGKVSGTYNVGGLIGYMSTDPSLISPIVKNSHAKVDVTATAHNVGGFVGGIGTGSKITSSSSDGNVVSTSNLAGGFVGWVGESTSAPHSEIINSKSKGSVEGTKDVGGFVGVVVNTNIIGSSADVDVSYTGTGGSSNKGYGGFVGRVASGAVIQNSHVIGDVNAGNGDAVGGFVGITYTNSHIIDSSVKSNVGGRSAVGGFAGQMHDDSIIEKSSFEGSVTATSSNSGGFAGQMYSGNSYIGESYSKANVLGEGNVGGFVGSMFAGNPTIENSYSQGHVEGLSSTSDNLGGFAGTIRCAAPTSAGCDAGTVKNSYAAVSVGPVGSGKGGFMGYVEHLSIAVLSALYFDDGVASAPGCGNMPPVTTPPTPNKCSGTVTLVAHSDMNNKGTFGGFDFLSIWEILPGAEYPSLQWEN